MYTYRVVLDAYDHAGRFRSARVSLFIQAPMRSEAFRQIRTVGIDRDGNAYRDLTRAAGWVGTNNMPPGGDYEPRSLSCWDVVSVRSVPRAGRSRVLFEYMTESERDRADA